MHVHVNGQWHRGPSTVAAMGCVTTPEKLITGNGLRPAGPFNPSCPRLDGRNDAVVVVVKEGECCIDLGWT